MATKPNCNKCGREWTVGYCKHTTGGNYELQFDGANITTIVWRVVKDCQSFLAGTIPSVSSNKLTIDLSDIEADGEYFLKLESPSCTGFCLPFKFSVTHNVGGVVDPDAPITAPSLTAQGINANTIKLDWTHTGGADTFLLQLSSDGSTWAYVGTYAGTLRTTNIATVTSDMLYYFRMRAQLSGGGESAFSGVVTATAEDTTTDPILTDHARKVLLHNAIEWDFNNLASHNSIVNTVVEGGVTHVTFIPNWWDIEKGKDNYDFSMLDSVVAYFAGKGLKVLLQIPYRFAYAGMLNVSDKAYIDQSNAILLRSGNYATSAIEGAIGSKSSGVYKTRLLKLVARIADHINNTPLLKTNVKQFLFVDGASNETGFYTSMHNGAFDDGDYRLEMNNDFQVWLQAEYGTIANLNAAWGRSYLTFQQITKGGYAPYVDATSVYYGSNPWSRDWWYFLLDKHKLFYRELIAAAKNPNSIDSSLTSTNTGIEMYAYVTEGLNGQGVFWGSGVFSMVSEFDGVFSSIGAAGGANVANNHLIAFAHRMSALRGSIPSKVFGQEMDGDVLVANGKRIGPSRLARTTFAQGAEWLIIVFYDESWEWEEDAYWSTTGDTLTFKQDLQLAVSEYVTGKTRTLPTDSSTLTFTKAHVLAAPNDPNGTTSAWLSAVNPDAEGLSSTYFAIQNTEIL